MTKISRDELKQRGIKRFFKSFNYAENGIRYALVNEQNLSVHLTVTLLVIIFGIILHVSVTEWILLIFAISLVIGSEMINTAIEACVDLNSLEKSKLARIAKDSASGAVLVFSICAALIGLIIFLPKIF